MNIQQSLKQKLSHHRCVVIIRSKIIWQCLKETKDLGTAGLRKNRVERSTTIPIYQLSFFLMKVKLRSC